MSGFKRRAKKTAAKSSRNTDDSALDNAEQSMDSLLAFEKFQTEIAPELQDMLLSGSTTKQILKKFSNYAAARVLTIALTERDSGKALSALKDILDRSEGRATETKKLEHSLAQIEDKDLDALLMAELDELDDIEAEFTEIDED